MVRNMPAAITDYVMLYINSPCVVVGKNQSIYKEVNFDYLRNTENLVARRISGGGTVYHDEGNLCFAFLSKFEESKVNNYRYFNQPIVDALQKASIDATFSPRNDILWQDKKISGNAQFTDRKNILSHGTLLVNTNKEKLRGALAPNPFEVTSKAVSSVRSAVMNISEGSSRFQTAEDLKTYLMEELPITDTYSFSDEQWQEITDSAITKFKSMDWLYGRNLTTHIIKPELNITVENGCITNIIVNDERYEIANKLIGISYSQAAISVALSEIITDEQEREKVAKAVF